MLKESISTVKKHIYMKCVDLPVKLRRRLFKKFVLYLTGDVNENFPP